jgi:glycerol-3-phosphate dehydrogenase
MPSSRFDLLIIGGGINGAAIARDAAGRGLRVLLVEQDDLAAHTSSASTKLIHGGLRYLEMRDFRLVRDGLKERETMLRTAPHIVRPLRFILPATPEARPLWMLRIGLWLYDLLAWGTSLPRSRGLRLAVGPLKPEIRRGIAYWDARTDDARLAILNALDARARGAVIVTRTRLAAARRENGRWLANLEDMLTGEVRSVSTRAIVNAAGPWVAEVLRERLGLGRAAGVRLVRGSHIVTRRLFEGEDAYILEQPDGRIVFAIPHERDFTLIGTTDVPVDDPGDAAISEAETDYLIAAINRHFAAPIGRADIVASFAGIRALHDDGAAEAKAVSREYMIALDDAGPPLLSIYGGKITTARALAEVALDRLQSAGIGSGKPWTEGAMLPESVPDPTLPRGEELGDGLCQRDVDHYVDHEWALTAEDILWRRTRLGLRASPDTVDRLSVYLSK